MTWEDFSSEDRLLLCCARKELDDVCRQEIKHTLENEINWDLLLKSGKRHGILPLVYFHFKDMNEIPLWVMEKLEDVYYRIAYRNMRIYTLLIKILNGLNARGIEVILLKGVELAEMIYGNIALRPMYDIDLLVKKEDVSEVEKIFLGLNCMPNR